jgi:predicted methyltransferase MtxX (methanogen marker protein 4)
MPLRGLGALLFLGGIVYALLSRSWGIGAIVFSLGAVLLGSDQLRVAQSRSDRAIGWVLILSGVFVVVDAMIWRSVGGA